MSVAWIRPRSLGEALEARHDHPDHLVLAGGTDLMVGALHRPPPGGVIDLFGLEEMSGVTHLPDGRIRIGAAATYAHLLGDAELTRQLPLLTAAVREIGAVQIQSRGTLGGNVMTSSPVGDSLPVLLALDADVELAAVSGSRTLPYEDFCTGYRQTAIRTDELLVAITVPPPPPGLQQWWRKVGTRRAQAISKVMLAATATVTAGALSHLRLALGAVAERPIRARATETALRGGTPGPELADRARAALAAEISPIDDLRSTAAYRRRVAANLVARFIATLAGERP